MSLPANASVVSWNFSKCFSFTLAKITQAIIRITINDTIVAYEG